MSEEKQIKDIVEILELCNDELIKNNKETYATLDYEDLLELKEMYNELEKFYAGELYTAKQLKNAENIGDIIKENKELKKQMGEDLDVVYIKGVYDERDKWKNKVKEKIEECIREADEEGMDFDAGTILERLEIKLLKEGE